MPSGGKSLISRLKSLIYGVGGWNHAQFLSNKEFQEKKGRLLDIGFGDAEFLKACRRLGYEVYGLEVAKSSIDIAREAGIEAFYGTVEDFVNEERKCIFDYVTLFETLEHLRDPKSCLRCVYFLLKSGGRIVISVPFRGRTIILPEAGDEPPGHFSKWSIKALRYALENTGFEVKRISIQPLSVRYMIAFFYISKLLNRLPERGGLRYVRVLLAIIFGLVFFVPVKLIKSHNGAGWHMYCEAIKR